MLQKAAEKKVREVVIETRGWSPATVVLPEVQLTRSEIQTLFGEGSGHRSLTVAAAIKMLKSFGANPAKKVREVVIKARGWSPAIVVQPDAHLTLAEIETLFGEGSGHRSLIVADAVEMLEAVQS